MGMIVLSTIALVVAATLYLYSKWRLSYWNRRGLKAHITFKPNIKEFIHDAYVSFRSKNLKHGGITVSLKSMYLPIDLELLKNILIRDFEHFPNHYAYLNEESDPLTGNLFNLGDDQWKKLRVKLTPTFTSGKMKMMFQTIADTTVGLVGVINENLSTPINIKEVLGRLTTDIIGSIGFGIDCNSLKDPDCDFRRYGKQVATVTWRIKMMNYIPFGVLKMCGFKMFGQDVIDFFMKTTENVVNYRQSKNIYRPDFMHLLLQLKNRGKIVDDGQIMDDGKKGDYMKMTELTAQSLVFFAAGFETSSSLMTYTLLELSQHQDIQDKLREEMKRSIEKHGGLTYEAIMEMSYLDQVCNESLRKYPPAFVTSRICSKDYKVPDTDVVIGKGTALFVPIYEIQHDPEYYPDPEKFDPERFAPENKSARHPMAFIPFGEGPRICIGARFGMLQAKVGLTAVLKNFKVTPSSKTKIPVEYQNHFIILVLKNDVYLNFTKVD